MFVPNSLEVYFYTVPVDMRKSIDGLSVLVADALAMQPLDGSLYVFRNKRADKIKILYWDKSGFCLWYKRLEKSKFKFPVLGSSCVELTKEQLQWLLDGLDFSQLTGHKTLKYSSFY